MPRPKVKPEDRQRGVVACVPCKQSKIRCDAGRPCRTCSRKSRESACVYQQPATTRRRRSRAIASEDNAHAETQRRDSDSPSIPSHDTAPGEARDSLFSNDADSSQGPRSRMLVSSRFEKVYIGETASLSYLHFLRQVVKHRVGPCSFTDGDFNNYMLELDSDGLDIGLDAMTDLDKATKDSFARYFLDATSGVLHLFTIDDLEKALEAPEAIDSPLDMATTFLVLAIGAQCRGRDTYDLYCSTALFSQAQKLAFEAMLHDPSPRMVRQFLLMAFFMLGACRRNAAFMYLGVASRAANTLGMHRAEHYRDLSDDDSLPRALIWMSLRVLDLIVNSILGRTGSIASNLDPRLPDVLQRLCPPKTTRELALQAAFDLCPFMDELERKATAYDVKWAESFLQRLQQWSKALPVELRRSADRAVSPAATQDRELFLGGAHVACVYYFAVLLTTRMFLTFHLLPESRVKRAEQPPRKDLNESEQSLANVCLNAAVNLATVGHDALESGQMLNNMCLLKAWMFAAGLLLGFWLFVKGPDAEVEQAFQRTRLIEKKLSLLSPQAGHYHDILSALSDAIALHQRRIADERKRATSRYMDQIFTANDDDVHQGSSQSELHDADNVDEVGTIDLEGNLDALTAIDAMPLDNMATAEGFPWPADDISFDWQPFAPSIDGTLT